MLLSNFISMVGSLESMTAYIGPGAGLSAIGAFLAMALGLAVALIGFIWYPVKRLLRKSNSSRANSGVTE